MQGNASLPEGGGCTVGADRGSYFFLKMISLLNYVFSTTTTTLENTLTHRPHSACAL